MSTEALKVGVLLVSGGVQLLDLAAIDVLGSCDPGYLKNAGLPDALLSKARPVEILYIAESGVGSNATLTSNGNILITVSALTVLVLYVCKFLIIGHCPQLAFIRECWEAGLSCHPGSGPELRHDAR